MFCLFLKSNERYSAIISHLFWENKWVWTEFSSFKVAACKEQCHRDYKALQEKSPHLSLNNSCTWPQKMTSTVDYSINSRFIWRTSFCQRNETSFGYRTVSHSSEEKKCLSRKWSLMNISNSLLIPWMQKKRQKSLSENK